MGQRLVIEITKNRKTIAAIYMHWSAYTSESIYELWKLGDFLNSIEDKDIKTIKELQLELIRHVEFIGGCIVGGRGNREWRYIKKKYNGEVFKEDGNRNRGLIAISENGINIMRKWSEGNAWIDVDSLECGTDIWFDHVSCPDDTPENWIEISSFPIEYDVHYSLLNEIYEKILLCEKNGSIFTVNGVAIDIF